MRRVKWQPPWFATALLAATALAACQRSDEPAKASSSPKPAATKLATTPVAQTRTYQCGDLAVTATFDGVGAMDLGFAGGPLTLPQVEAASGARFADSQGNEFWSKGEAATFTLAGQQARTCAPAAAGG